MAEIYVIGRIESGENFENNTGHCCKWTIQAGNSWKKISGHHQGQTQVDTPYHSKSNQVIWSHPIDIHFVTKELQGWPKIVLEIFRQDSFGRGDLSGYAVSHIPTTPGLHTLKVPTWRPTGTARDEIERYFLGGSTELTELELISNSLERFRLRTISSGTVTIELSIILKNFAKFGIEN